MRHLFSSPLGSCAPPCAPTNKLIGNALGYGIMGLSGLGSIASTLASDDASYRNRINTQETNQANKDIAEATNKANKEIADEANRYNKLMQDEMNAWNLAQWNRENEYNSPVEQVKRLKEAGINPYALYGSAGGSIPAGQLTSAPAQAAVAPQMIGAEVQPYHETGLSAQMMGNFFNSLSDFRLKNAEADKVGADTQIAHNVELRNQDTHLENIKYLRELARGQGYVADMAKEQLNYYALTRKYDLAKLMGDIRQQSDTHQQMISQKINTDLNSQLLRIEAMYSPQMNDAQLRNYRQVGQKIKAEIGLLEANKMLTDEQRLHEVEKKWNTIISGNGQSLDNQLKRDLYSSTIENYKWTLQNNKWSAIDAFMHSGRGYGSTDRPIWQSLMDSADGFDNYSKKFGKIKIPFK